MGVSKSRSCSLILTLLTAFSVFGCAKEAAVEGCSAISGDAWVPNIAGVAATNHDSSVVISQTTASNTGSVIGFAQSYSAPEMISFSVSVGDLGAQGSFTLEATPSSYPAGVSSILPILVSLVDPNGKEYVNLSADCAASGFFTSAGTENSVCAPAQPSAFFDRNQWMQHSLAVVEDAPSVYTFPTCNWGGGAAADYSNPACAFNSSFFTGVPARLPAGTYTAKYVLIAGNATTLTGKTGRLDLKVIKKTDSNAGGATDVNVVLVGNKNINASRTAKGKMNLNTVFKSAMDLYAPAGSGVKFGTVRVFEWDCLSGGDAYANAASYQLGELFRAGGVLLPSTSGNAINLYMIYQFSDNPSFLGIAGALGGPYTLGTDNNGVAVATFGKLETFNPACTDTACPLTSQEWDFVDFSATIAHEMGHYFGLNHPSESGGTRHDAVADTPICTTKQQYSAGPPVIPATSYLTNYSCLVQDTNVYAPTGLKCSQACLTYDTAAGVFCSDRLECQFNHLMWWSAKYFKEGVGTGDGNLISTDSRAMIDYHPLIQ